METSLPLSTPAADPTARLPVVLLHGLSRRHHSLARMAGALARAGFSALNLSYPSTRFPLATLTEEMAWPAVRAFLDGAPEPVNFVTHSMGGIIVRQLAVDHPELAIGRVVMLAPPNRGSEVVDRLRHNLFFRLLNGPAGQELGTGPESVPNRLGPAPFELGIIAGDRSVNPLLSLLIPGPNDGKVAVARAGLPGMTDFLVVHATHPLIMRNRLVIAQTIHFLRHGLFSRPAAAGGEERTTRGPGSAGVEGC